MKAQKPSKLKNRLINFSLTLGTCLILCIIYLFVFDNYKEGLRGYEWFKKSTQAPVGIEPLTHYDAIQLGKVHTPKKHPKSSYLNFPKEKPTGTYRIGIFGGSFVEGIGAAQGYDFPSLLEKKYLESGRDEVEVVNFGTGAYGMNRSFYLWNCLGKGYNLDLVIFNPRPFHPPRDRTFILHSGYYGDVHGRYIWKNEIIQYIPVLGSNRAETSARYYSPVPAWQYWRYETKTPVPFRAVLPKGKELKRNPFYYHSDPEAEWKALYSAIFDSIRKVAPRFMVSFFGEQMGAFQAHLASKNFETFTINTDSLDPAIYVAPDNHYTGLGNQVIAEALFDYLQDSIDIQFPVFSFEKKHIESTDSFPNWEGLSKVKRLFLSIQEKELAVFYHGANGWKQRPNIRTKPVIDFEKLGIKAVAAINKFPFHHYLPLSKAFELGTLYTMRARFWVAGQEKVIPLTEIVPMTSFWGVGDPLSNKYRVGDISMTFAQKNRNLMMEFATQENISQLSIELEGNVILKGQKVDNRSEHQLFDLSPVMSDWITLRGGFDQRIDIPEIPSNGIVDLMVEYKNGEVKNLPFLRYQVNSDKID